MAAQHLKYCPYCGALGVWEVPLGDHLPRLVCRRCDRVHYQNPQVIAGCVVECGGRILMCRRAIEPRAGCWTLPAGYMESGETIEEAAIRETEEETGVVVTVDGLYSLFSVLERDHVYVMFRGTTSCAVTRAGDESSEVAFLRPHDVAWGQLAYPVIEHILERYIKERAGGAFALYVGSLHNGTVCDVGPSHDYDPRQFRGYRDP